MFRVVTQVPRWVVHGCDQRLTVPWRHKEHKTRRLFVDHVLTELLKALADGLVDPASLIVGLVVLDVGQQPTTAQVAACKLLAGFVYGGLLRVRVIAVEILRYSFYA